MHHRVVVTLVVSSCVSACNTPAPPIRTEPAPLVVTSSKSQAPQVYPTGFVWASRLNVRQSADASSQKLGSLALNTEVVITGRAGDFVAVVTPKGRRGFVAASLLGDKRLTEAVCREHMQKASSDVEKLTWAQRLAALKPNDAVVLEELSALYLRNGDKKNAKIIRDRLRLSRLQLYRAESPGNTKSRVLVDQIEPSSDPASQKSAFENDPPATVFILPQLGPAVSLAVTSVARELIDEMGYITGVFATTDQIVASPLVASLSAPAACWSDDLKVVPLASADRMRIDSDEKSHECDAGSHCGFEELQTPFGLLVEYISETPDPNCKDSDENAPCFPTVTREHTLYQQDAAGALIRKRELSIGKHIIGLRDIDCDQVPEIFVDDCSEAGVYTLENEMLAQYFGYPCGGC